MATTKINLEKAEATPASVPATDHSDRLQEMEAALRKFFERLSNCMVDQPPFGQFAAVVYLGLVFAML